MSAQTEVKNLIKRELTQIRARNAAYSMRAFSKRIGISHAALSEILAGKRLITKKAANKIFKGLSVSPQVGESLISRLETRTDKNKKRKKQASSFKPIDMSRYPRVWEWHYFAILSLSETSGFRSEPEWIAKRLGLSVAKIKSALNRLEREGLLTWTEKSGWQTTGNQFATSSGVPNAVIRKSHIKSVEQIRKSMETSPLEFCNFSSITMAINPEKLGEASTLIQNFRRSLCAFLEEDEKVEVYKMSIQLYPLSMTVGSTEDESGAKIS